MLHKNRFSKTLLVLLVIGIWGLLLLPLATPVVAQSSRPKWEYETEIFKGFNDEDIISQTRLEQLLRKVGAEGWEIGEIKDNYLIFKRRR